MEKLKSMKKHLERVWEDIVHLLEDAFPFPIQTPATAFQCPPDEFPSSSTCQIPAIPSLCPPEELPSSTCQTPLQFTKLRTPCKECGIKRVKQRELLISKRMLSHKFQTVITKQRDNRKLRQAFSSKVKIERNLRAHLNNLKKELKQKEATLKGLANENLLLKNTGHLHEIASIKHSKVKMRSAHRRRDIHQKNTERALKRSNAFLSKKVRDLELENEVLRAKAADQSHNLARCISTREDNKTYSTACRKTIYSCLEYQVPVTSVCNVIKAVLEHLGNVTA